jgi:hypothetical protein
LPRISVKILLSIYFNEKKVIFHLNLMNFTGKLEKNSFNSRRASVGKNMDMDLIDFDVKKN